MSARFRSSIFAFPVFAIVPFASANPGLTGSWFNPERDGEGFHIEILDNNQALVIWFTYPGSSDNLQTEQAWILGIGTVNGDTITIVDAYRTRGPQFGEGYDKDALEEYTWGDMSFSFTSLDKGTVNYD